MIYYTIKMAATERMSRIKKYKRIYCRPLILNAETKTLGIGKVYDFLRVRTTIIQVSWRCHILWCHPSQQTALDFSQWLYQLAVYKSPASLFRWQRNIKEKRKSLFECYYSPCNHRNIVYAFIPVLYFSQSNEEWQYYTEKYQLCGMF